MANRINILASHRQSFTYAVKNKRLEVSLYFSDNLSCFFMDLTYGNFSSRGTRIVNGLNILSKYENIIPFGIQIAGSQDPHFIDDFENENNIFLILDENEIRELYK
jgi:hypothetical protein